MIERQAVYFKNPFQVETRQESCSPPQMNEVLVETVVSAVSAGTELLLYRGLMPADMTLDATIEGFDQGVQYPLKYGYAAVGRIIDCGSEVDASWLGRFVFAFQPHQSHFCTTLDMLHPVPDGLAAEDAIFLPNMETAVSFVMDGKPVIGENILILGQGVVGLLTTALLTQFPLGKLVTVDRSSLRRDWSCRLGADLSLDIIEADRLPMADLCYELSGDPGALNMAIAQAVFSGRIVVGSWYGQKEARLDLGGRFHREHLQLISSQVSRLHPQWGGRWDKARRLDMAWHMIDQIQPSRLITHRFTLSKAHEHYQLLADAGETAVQTIFTYSS